MERVNMYQAMHEADNWRRTDEDVTYTTIGEANLIFAGLIFQYLLEGENGDDKYYDAFVVKHHAETLDDLYKIAHKNGLLSVEEANDIKVKVWYDDDLDRYLVEEM